MTSILNFFKDNGEAWKAIGILLTFLASMSSLYFSVRNNKAVHYVNSITKSRIEWIQKLRLLISEFISMVDVESIPFYSPYQGEAEACGKYLMQCKQKEVEINFLLNATDIKDRHIIELVKEIRKEFNNLYENIIKIRGSEEGAFYFTSEQRVQKEKIVQWVGELEKETQIYLKSEWNRVKYESQGKIYERKVQEFDLQELKEKYNNPNYKNKVWKRRFILMCAKMEKFF